MKDHTEAVGTGRLAGQTALVTGGSRGLGRWICTALAAQGAVVAVNYANNAGDAEETLRLIREAGGSGFTVQGDITDEAQAAQIVRTAEERFGGPLGILVNNATGPQPMLSVEDSTWDDYMLQLNFFVKAPLLLLKAALPGMKKEGTGSIIQIGSEVVQIGNAEFSSYVTAKSAMIGMTRSWASELGPHGIRVNLVAPGWIPVERHAGIETEGYAASVPLRKMGTPADIADAVVFLASGESRFITGQCLSVNGGNTYCI